METSTSFGLGVKRPLDRGTTVVVNYEEDGEDENSTPLEQNSNGVLSSAKRPKIITSSSPVQTKKSTIVSEEKEYSRNPPARGSFLTVTATSGNRVYLPLVSPEELLRSPSLSSSSSSSSSFTRRTSSLSWNGKGVRPQLLSAPISTLIESVEQEQRRKLFQELQQEEEEEEEVKAKERADSSTRSLTKQNSSKSISLQSPTTENQLWVDKYAPKGFVDLISDERTNRELLQWLKEWDWNVFGRNSAPSTSSSSSSSSSAFRSKPNNYNNNGPKAKAVLLSGPPGLGKTTLAHVIASHAGYRPVEVNASDDRSRDALMEKVVNATEMRTLDGKPNCLIIDEIDGTVGSESRGPIEALVKQLLVTAKTTNKSGTGGGKKSKKKDEEQEEEEEREDEEDERSNKMNKEPEGGTKTGGRGKKKKKKQEKPLMRPIICICNDLYAPQLRKLKEVARVFRFKKPDSSRLCLRLKEICTKEKVNADMHTLATLIDMNNNDIRASINALQFASKRIANSSSSSSSNNITVETLSNGFGYKDLNRNAFDIWKEIFQTPRSGETGRSGGKLSSVRSINHSESTGVGREGRGRIGGHISFLYENLSSYGDLELLIDGCHENFLSVHYNDPEKYKTSSCLEWLEFADELFGMIHKQQMFQAYSYLASVPVAFHLLCNTHSTPELSFPKQERECRQERSQNSNVLKSFLLHFPPALLPFHSVQSLTLDLLSPLMDILSPKLRSINPALMSKKEKEEVKNLTEVMATYSLNWKESNKSDFATANEVTTIVKLDPAIDRLVAFKGQVNTERKELSTVHKQLIASGVTALHLQRSHEKFAKATGSQIPTAPFSSSSSSSSSSVPAPPKFDYSKVKPKDVQPLPVQYQQAKDFFGRPVVAPTSSVASASASASPSSTGNPPSPRTRNQAPKASIIYKFHEGYTNAVRRTVFVKDFL